MRALSLRRVMLVTATALALCGFTFLRHHITRAPVIDAIAPFYGTGLVIGPERQLPGLVKHVPAKMRLYKWLTRKGDTQYVPGLRREAGCSLSEVYVDLADSSAVRTLPNFERRLRSAAGLDATTGSYPNGCSDPVLGLGARYIAGGRAANGALYGAGPDFHLDGSIVLYHSDGAALLGHEDIELAPDDTNQTVSVLQIADLDRDGKDDYVVALDAYGANAVSRIAILRGDGTGHFSAPTFYTIVAAPSGSGQSASTNGIAIADLDGDQVPDIAASFSLGATSGIATLHGHGDGTFDAAVPITAANDIGFAIIAADLNGDGKRDIASGDGYLLLGDGAGNFSLAPGQRFDAGRVAAGDFNGDGKADLADIALIGDGSPIHVWLGDGSGNFARVAAGYGTGYGSGVADLTVTDLDGDGKADLVVGSSGDGFYGPSLNSQGQTQFLLGRGDGTFRSPPYWEKTVAAIGDFDRDGHGDLIELDVSSEDAGVRPLLGDGSGGFNAGTFSSFGFNFFTQTFQAWIAADLNADGKADLVALSSSTSQPPSGTLRTRLGNGDGTFQSSGTDLATDFALGTFGYTNGTRPVAADLTGDGKLDIAAIGYGSDSSALYLFAGNGDGSMQAPAAIGDALTGDGNPPSAVVAGDFDGDGKPDLVVMDAGRRYETPAVPGSVRVYRNLGGGAFATPTVLPGGLSYGEGLAIADVNGDGHADIVLSVETQAYSNDTLYVFLGHGDGTFAAARTQVLADYWYQSLVLADADGDGKIDLVLGNCCGLTFASYARGDGTGAFAEPAIMPLTVSPQMLLLSDITGDGHPDLVVQGGYSTSATVRLFVNTFKDAIFDDGFDGQ